MRPYCLTKTTTWFCRSLRPSSAITFSVSQSRQTVVTNSPERSTKSGSGRGVGKALADHHQGAGAELLDVTGQEEGLADAVVAGNGTVRMAELFGRERRRELARVPDLEAVGKHRDLDGGVGGVVAVRDGVDDGFADDIGRDLVAHGRLRALGACADTAVQLGHDEVVRHVHLLEEVALEDAVEGDGPGDFSAMEVHAPNLGAREEPLRVAAEKQNGGLGGLAVKEQVEVCENVHHCRSFGQRKLAFLPGPAHKGIDRLGVDIIKGGVGAWLFLEGAVLYQALGEEMLDQAGAQRGREFGDGGEAAPDELVAGLADEGAHLGVARPVVGAF